MSFSLKLFNLFFLSLLSLSLFSFLPFLLPLFKHFKSNFFNLLLWIISGFTQLFSLLINNLFYCQLIIWILLYKILLEGISRRQTMLIYAYHSIRAFPFPAILSLLQSIKEILANNFSRFLLLILGFLLSNDILELIFIPILHGFLLILSPKQLSSLINVQVYIFIFF